MSHSILSAKLFLRVRRPKYKSSPYIADEQLSKNDFPISVPQSYSLHQQKKSRPDTSGLFILVIASFSSTLDSARYFFVSLNSNRK